MVPQLTVPSGGVSTIAGAVSGPAGLVLGSLAAGLCLGGLAAALVLGSLAAGLRLGGLAAALVLGSLAAGLRLGGLPAGIVLGAPARLADNVICFLAGAR